MKKALFLVLTFAIVIFCSVSAHTGPDFSGTWALDVNKSDAGIKNPAAEAKMQKVVLVIKQTATKLTIQRSTGDVADNLDGSESVNSLPGGGQSKTKMRWAGDALVSKTTSNSGGMEATSTDVRNLSANGKEMMLKVSTKMPSGERKQTLIYNKQ